MMSYGESYDYLRDLGFTFTFDNSKSIYFSDTHVHWQGREVGTMYQENMMFEKDGMVHQFNYKWGNIPEFKNFITDLIISKKQKQYNKMLDDIKKDFV